MIKVLSAKPQQPPAEAHSRILFFCNRLAKPFYLGRIADDIGWSLERTEGYLEYMVSEGVIRHASKDEMLAINGMSIGVAYCLNGFADAQKAHLK